MNVGRFGAIPACVGIYDSSITMWSVGFWASRLGTGAQPILSRAILSLIWDEGFFFWFAGNPLAFLFTRRFWQSWWKNGGSF